MLRKSQSFLPRLLQSLATRRRYKQLRESVSTPEKSFGRAEWVLSRPLYRFTHFDFKSIPKQQRAQALELQIRQWTPFSRSGRYILWEQDTALVWAWDTERVESALSANKLKLKSTTIIPETLLHPRLEKGVRLVTCVEGYEGQVWQDGILIGSRWWPNLPGAGEWINFQRDAATPPESQAIEVSRPHAPGWGEKPWGKSAALDNSITSSSRLEPWIVLLLGVSLFAACTWYGVQLIKLQTAIDEREVELKALALRVEPILRARGQALEALSRINLLQAIDPYPDQVIIFGKLAETLPKDGLSLKEWEYLNGKLKVLLASPNKLVSSEYIKLFQSMGMFKNVQALPSSDPTTLMLSMDTLPSSDIKSSTSNNEPAKKEGDVALPLR